MNQRIYLPFITMILLALTYNRQVEPKSKMNNELNISSISTTKEPYQYDSGDVVNRGYLDRSGNMWFTTLREGVYKYDDKKFTQLSVKDGLCSNLVNAVVQDHNGDMWFGTAKGLCKYDGTNFTNISLPQEEALSVSPETGLPSRKTETILSLIQSKNGDLWIGTDASGAYRYDGKTFTSFLKFEGRIQPHDNVYNNCITSIIEDKNGHIWICSFTHGGLNEFDGTTMTHHPLKDGYGDGMISTSYKDREGNLWFGTRNSGIYKYDYTKFENIVDSKTGEQIPMASLVIDKDKTMWIGSFAREGAYRYKNQSFVELDMPESEKLFDIKFVSEDKHGNIWFGGRHGLLWRFDGKELKDFTQAKRGG